MPFGSLLVGLLGAAVVPGAGRRDDGQGVRRDLVILGWPVWIAQALMVPGFALMALAGFYMFVHLSGPWSNTTGRQS
jgi:hypothetical protein